MLLMSLFAIFANKDMSGQLLDQLFYLQLCNPVVNFDANLACQSCNFVYFS